MRSLALAELLGGLALLVLGAEWLVRGAVRLAVSGGVSPLVIGLTVVAFGTSSPELAVTLFSTISDRADLALGNVVGSNIANVFLVLGVAALVRPLVVRVPLILVDLPLMIFASVLVLVLSLDGRLGQLDGVALALLAAGYALVQFQQGRRAAAGAHEEFEKEYRPADGGTGKPFLLVLAGIALLAGGSRSMVEGAVAIARVFGVSELLIGLTVVAIGTSLPEMATSIVAAVKGQRDIAVGNIVGSNLFNLLAVLGAAAVLAPIGMPVPLAALRFDLPVMVAGAILCLPVFASGRLVGRWEGAFLLTVYGAYLLFLVLAATDNNDGLRFC